MASNKDNARCACGKINVEVVKGDLATEKTDAIVCAATKTLDLSRGRASKAILTAAGDILQQDCNDGYPDGIEYGKVAVVNAGRLPCKRVFLVALPIWGKSDKDQKGDKEKKNLETTIHECLLAANDNGIRSLALPGLGTGLLKYPLDTVARTTMDCVERFSHGHPKAALTNVVVVVFPKDTAAFKAFEEEVNRRTGRGAGDLGGATNHMALLPPGLANMSVGQMGVKSILSGRSMSVEEKRDGIIIRVIATDNVASSKVRGDVLVNITQDSSCVDAEGCSFDVREEAGKDVQREFRHNYEEELDPGQVAITDSYKLTTFKRLYHIYMPKKVSEKSYSSKRSVQRVIENCLQQACDDGFKSITFPALGDTGSYLSPELCANMLCQYVRKFEEETPDSKIKKVTVFVDKERKHYKKILEAYEEAVDRSMEYTETKNQDQSKDYLYKSLETALKGAIERSDKGPDRGTLDWFKFMYKRDPRTPSHWSTFHSNKTIKEWHMGFDDIRISVIPVDRRQFVVIEKLVQDTWQSQHVGQGRDSSGLGDLNYTNIKVTNVERIENTVLFEKYIQARQEVFRKVIRRGQLKQLEDLQGTKGPILSTKAIDSDCFLSDDIYPEVNEHYMFHGTQDAIVGVIAEQGLDSRLAGSSTMFGQGVYAAESSTKADQYADDKNNRSRLNRKMFLIRMCLGKIHVHGNPEAFARPPCTGCTQSKCTCGLNDYCDSVVGDGSWIFREFVVYDRTQVYPEYIITYDRVK